jgi:O-methyltransferase
MKAPEELYLDLMKRCLTRTLFNRGTYQRFRPKAHTVKGTLQGFLQSALRASMRVELCRLITTDPTLEAEGKIWPPEAETMIGLRRLDNLQRCIENVLRDNIPGDLIETGVWRGGAAIFMRAVLKAYGDTERTVWAADSFQGLPRPNPERYPADAGDRHWTFVELAVSLEEVRANFARYGLLDDQVQFLVGWFRETLPSAPIARLAILRLDGDMYESTMDAFTNLYGKLSVGGYVIVDDFAMPTCRAAVEDFRARHGIRDTIEPVDWSGMFWRRVG